MSTYHPPTQADLLPLIGRTGLWSTPMGNFAVRVRVLAARRCFGRIELQVTPLEGSGTTWTPQGRVELDPLDPPSGG